MMQVMILGCLKDSMTTSGVRWCSYVNVGIDMTVVGNQKLRLGVVSGGSM